MKGEDCLSALKNLLCGSFIPKCNAMNPLRPFVACESVCETYAKACGKPRELVPPAIMITPRSILGPACCSCGWYQRNHGVASLTSRQRGAIWCSWCPWCASGLLIEL